MAAEKILVTGGAGFIGSNVCLSALGRGMQVIAFDNLSRRGAQINIDHLQSQGGERFKLVTGDIRDEKAILLFVKSHSDAKAVFHLAGQVAVTTSVEDPAMDLQTNLLGTFHLLEGLRLYAPQMPMVFASTNKVYGETDDLEVVEEEEAYRYRDFPEGIGEDCPLDFHSPYGCSKGAADQYVRDYARIYGLRTVVFRQSCIYGYRQFGIEDQGWVAWFTIASLFDKPITIYGNGKQVRDVLFIDDLIGAYWDALAHIDTTAGNVFNIGGGRFRMSLLVLLAYLEKALGKSIQIAFSDPRPGDQRIFVSDTAKARKEFGWSPTTDVETGVGRLIQWAEENRELFVKAGLV